MEHVLGELYLYSHTMSDVLILAVFQFVVVAWLKILVTKLISRKQNPKPRTPKQLHIPDNFKGDVPRLFNRINTHI